MKIVLTSVMIEATDQDKALKFYTDVLGFIKKTEIPMGRFKWLTVVSPETPDGVELLLEPMEFPPAKVFQKALHDAGIPAASFGVTSVQNEYDKLEKQGVRFTKKPTSLGMVTIAVLEDGFGNLIQIAEKH